MTSDEKTVDAFLSGLAPGERAVFEKIRRAFLRAGASVGESMEYRMPTYRIGERMIGAFNQQKHYLCLYLNPEAVDPHRAELKKLGLDCGKSCIRFRRPADLPLALAKKIIAGSAKLAKR